MVVFLGGTTGDEKSCLVCAMRAGESNMISGVPVSACVVMFACFAPFGCVAVSTRYTRRGGLEYDAVTGVVGVPTLIDVETLAGECAVMSVDTGVPSGRCCIGSGYAAAQGGETLVVVGVHGERT